MRIAGIVLAAGASTRLGRPKQLLILDHETLLERAVRVAAEVCEDVIVVLGSQAELVQGGCNLRKAQVVTNEDWREGMGASIRAGMKALNGFDAACDGVILMTCDMPAVTTEHLRKLIATGSVAASTYARRHGVPAFFPGDSFPELTRLQGERGAQVLLKEAPGIALPFGEIDIDTIDDFERAQTFWP